ncbi:MAG TPA: hypothetical protein VF146_19985 [Bryobacteraceae bacterium]
MGETQPLPPTKTALTLWGRLLVVFLAVNGLGGVAGGIALMNNVMPFPEVWLQGTPFRSYFSPGLILFLLVGCVHLVAAFLLLWRAGLARIASLVAGLVLLGWMAGELKMIGFQAPIQIWFVTLGPLEIGLSFTKLRRG